jgi:hypothetical protein
MIIPMNARKTIMQSSTTPSFTELRKSKILFPIGADFRFILGLVFETYFAGSSVADIAKKNKN